ncbi:Ig-like domain-containing protein [Propionicicella superfundia]|uniref:Ig-like domain-containing protein n=1 Tax=Propionicicella superfundia TaxID=348582 RepID=UPI00041B529A|nr:Ig-like domain-containing protein [Propionicicella superfundia]
MAARTRKRLWTALTDAWSGIVVGVVGVALLAAAVTSPGFSVADVSLHDGAVYVVKSESRLVGQLNSEVDELATAVRAADQAYTVLQSGDTVLLQSTSSNQIQQLDFARGVPGSPVQLPAAASVSLGKDTIAVVNPTDGRMWTGDIAGVLAIDFAQAPAQIDLGEGGLATVTARGRAIGLSLRDQAIVRLVDGEIVRTKLPWQIQAPYNVQLSAVGDKAVVLDRGSQQVWIEGDAQPLTVPGGGSAQLASPTDQVVQGSETARAVLANASGLVGVGSSRLFSLVSGVSATPGVPLVANGCAYGVFANGRFAKLCSDGQSQLIDIPQYVDGDLPVFRANRGVVVLNASRVGYIWMVDEGMKLITDWKRVTPSEAEQGDEDDDQETTVVPPDRDTVNHPPVAVDDPKLAARAGRTTLLPIRDNDYDPDGDIITILGPPSTNQGTLSLIRGGTAIQLYLPVTATGTVTFTYTISDGRDRTATATATVKVLPQYQSRSNAAPVQTTSDPLVVALGSSVSKRVLLDWSDPDGDDLVLVGARVVDGDDEVDFTPEGVLNYQDVGTRPGRKEVEVTVSDGYATTTGVVVVDARKGRDIQPVANGDYYSTTVNQEITLKPLENDVGANLKLARVTREGSDFTAEANYQDNTIRFTTAKAGTYYLRYVVTNGYGSTGIIRVDVIAPVAQNRAPIAARDVALLPEGGSVLVDPLANDEDPDGDVLVIQSVSTNPALTVKMDQRHLLRISAITEPSEPITLTYKVSDGVNSVTGTVVVIPAPSGAKVTPVAVTDEITVRAGDTATVNVLRNDYSPIGLDLQVDTELVQSPGVAWVDGETVRFTAPGTAGQYRAVYRIHDSRGQEASAQVKFNVVASDVENQAPKPEVVTGRVLENSITKIPIPLEGIDPNGDSVRLLGLNTGPTRGRIVSVGERWIEYQSYDSTGTDSFEYQVTDSRGAVGVGTIRVGIVPRDSDVNTPPVAGEDVIRTRPGRTVRLSVLSNDSDPDGESISLRSDGLLFPFEVDIVDDTDLTFTVPSEAGEYSGQYTVTDARGRTSTGVVRVISDPEAPLLAPVVRDDQVLAGDVVGKTVVDVPVLDNDYDPDGAQSALKISIPGGDTDTASVPDGTGTPVVRVRIGPTMRLVRYEVTDADGQRAWAVIIVPGAADMVPAAKSDAPALQVVAGETISIALGDYVVGTQGRVVSLVSEDRIWATNGQATGVGPRTVEFSARSNYIGPASVVFEVTDGRSASDTTGKKAVISLPIQVLSRPTADGGGDDDADRLDNPPTVAGTITVDIGQGEPEKSVELAQYVSDPDGDAISFEQFSGGDVAGVAVRFSGDWSVVSATAELTAAPGAKATYTGSVTDGRGGRASITVEFVVVESTRPRPTVTDDAVVGDQGRPSVVAALANDRSNLLGDTTLVIVAAEVVSGSGTVSHTADAVTITPADDYVGELRVRYSVQDGTKSVRRQVDGYVIVTVRGTPSRPGVAVLNQVGNTTLDVTWSASVPNGHPIQKYVVTATAPGSTVTQDCAATTCTIRNLRNGSRYRLTVAAVNALGSSESSAASAEMMPDVLPSAPAAPSLTAADGQITVTWSVPANEGTAIESYTLLLTGDTTVREVIRSGEAAFTTRTHTFTGLTNGTQYSVALLATNQAGDSPYGPAASEVPAAPPSSPTGVEASDDSSAINGRSARVSWGAPAATNGAPVTEYLVYANGELNTTVPGTQTSATIALSGNGDVAIAVSARNKAGEGARSAGVTVTVFGAPSAPTSFDFTTGDRSVTLTAVNVPANGRAGDRLRVRVEQADGTVVRTDDDVVLPWRVGGLTGGQEYRFVASACAGSKCGPEGNSPLIDVYSAPEPPRLQVVGVTAANALMVRWTAPTEEQANGNTSVETYVNWGAGDVRVSGYFGTTWASEITVDAARDITAYTIGNHGLRSREAVVHVEVPMSDLTVASRRVITFTLSHQSAGTVSCEANGPGSFRQSFDVTILEGSGSGRFEASDALAAGAWTITCGVMTRSVSVP